MIAGDGLESNAALVARAASQLAASGVEDAAGDARRLFAHALGLDAVGALAALASTAPPADADARARLEALVAERARRRPMSHLLGRRAFFAHEFEVGPDVLDPRPESETLVELALALAPADRPMRVLDLGVGSGCLLLSVLAARPRAVGLGVDKSRAALATAARNRAALGLEGRAALRESDWLSAVDGAFTLILCNPPYIAEADVAELAPETRDWEPRAALTPGPDALAAYRALAAPTLAHVEPGGALLFEVGPGQAQAVSGLLRAAGWGDVATFSDVNGAPRVVAARREAEAPPGGGFLLGIGAAKG